MAQKTFYEYFKESMDSMGLPAPDTLFNSVAAATGTIATILGVVEKFGTAATVAELVLAAPKGVLSVAFAGEALLVVGGVTASFYAGACIGALAYATGQYSADKLWVSSRYSVGQLINRATANGIKVPGSMISVLAANPTIGRATPSCQVS
jgi:hypothetical protein